MKPIHFWKSKNVRKCICCGRLWRACMKTSWDHGRSYHHTQEDGVLSFPNRRARPCCRLVLGVRILVAFVMCHWCYSLWPPVGQLLENNNNTRPLSPFQSVAKSIGPTRCYCPKGKLNWIYAHRIVTLTLKPQTWIRAVVKHQYM